MGRFPRRRKVCESVGERRCDVAGSLVTFSSRLHRRLHTSWRGWWGLDRFSGIVKWCWDCAGGRAQSARVSGSDGATAQAVCRPCVFLVTPMHAHISARAGNEADFSGIEKWCWDCAGGRAQSARVSGSDGATAQAVPTLCVSSHTDACSHLGAGGGRGGLFHREMVLGLCRWPRRVCESVGERWRDGAGRVPTLGLLMSM